MLPENMFINLLETNLQERILSGKELDIDVKSAMETLIQEGPTNLKNNLEDWKIEEVDGRKTIFYKGKNYIPNYNEMWSKCTMITKQQDTWGNWKPTTQYDNLTTLLVARILNICEELHTRMWNMSTV